MPLARRWWFGPFPVGWRCPASSSWQGFLGVKCRVGGSQVRVEWPVPGDRFVRADLVVLEAVLLGVLGEHDGVVDVVDEQPAVFQRAEPAFAGPVLAGRRDARAEVMQLGVIDDELLEPVTSVTVRRCRSRS